MQYAVLYTVRYSWFMPTSVLFRVPDMYFYIGQNSCCPIYSGSGSKRLRLWYKVVVS